MYRRPWLHRVSVPSKKTAEQESNSPEWMLERSLDRNALVARLARAGQTHQDLDLADGGAQQLRGGVVDRLVARDDGGVRAGHERGRGRVDGGRGVRDEALVRVLAEQDGDVGVARRGVDERQEGVRDAVRVGLFIDIGIRICTGATYGASTYETREVCSVDGGSGLIVGLPDELGTL